MPPEAWLVSWQDTGTDCRRAFTDEREARSWAERIADTEECFGVAVLPLVEQAALLSLLREAAERLEPFVSAYLDAGDDADKDEDEIWSHPVATAIHIGDLRFADTTLTKIKAALPLSVVKDSFTTEPSGNSGGLP